MNLRDFLLPAGLAVLAAAVAISQNTTTTTTPAAATTSATTCKFDWTKCADNSDMANNYDGWSRAKVACKYEANDRAKYGTPKWPWLAFSSFYPGTNYNTGIVTLIEGDAQFQNGFGAMVRSIVTCEYDLRTKKVIHVSIGER